MKILMIASDFSVIGGAERVITNLSNALHQETNNDGDIMQVDILSISLSNSPIPWQLKNGIRLIQLTRFLGKDDIKALPFIKRFFENAKIILFYKPKFFIKERRILKTSEILKNLQQEFLEKFYAKHHKMYDIFIDQSGWHNYIPNKPLPNTKFVRVWHNGINGYELSFGGPPPNSDKYDVWVHFTKAGAKMWSNHKCIRVIPNFLPQIPQKSTNHAQKVVLSLGRLSHEKGFLRLLDIWKMLHSYDEINEWKFVIVGEGPQKQEIEDKINSLNLQDSVILKPFTTEIHKEYLSASIYVMGSHFEGFPMVLLESTSYGLPPISFDIKTGPSDIIENEKSGFLIADGDLQGFANKLKLLMSDENLRHKFGENAKKIVSEKFSKEAVLGLWLNLFDEIK